MSRLSLPGGARRMTLGLAAGLLLVASSAVVLRGTGQDDADAPRSAATNGDAPAAAGTAGTGEQPIAFSHEKHVGELGFDCQLCHAHARRGPIAGIPSVARCVGCHRVVQPDRPEIQKILQYWENEEPIPWRRVHDLPDHVRFTHKAHVRAGVGCQTCHGDVGRMHGAEQVSPLTMGWCLTCHQEQQASTDCLTCH